MAQKKKDEFDDLGLGTKAPGGGFRALNKDGSFNVRKTNISFFERFNFFHVLISMSWAQFIGLIILGYFLVNLVFAGIYVGLGMEYLTGINGISSQDLFMEAFFFSAQTITTLGYGQVAPIGPLANTIAAAESMLGLLGFALATGLLYGRFSKPSGKIKYSEHAVISPYKNINAFMFRVINPQGNQLLEVEVTVTLSMRREHSDLRDFHLLELERSKVIFFPYMWTIVHPINESSPIFGISEAEMLTKDAEFIIMMKAFDESFSQTVYSRSSYKAFEIKWAQKFVYLVKQEEDGISVDVGRLDETEPAALN